MVKLMLMMLLILMMVSRTMDHEDDDDDESNPFVLNSYLSRGHRGCNDKRLPSKTNGDNITTKGEYF